MTLKNNKAAAISKTKELPGDIKSRLGELLFDFAETMVNLKSWAIVIFVLNSHISCQSLKHLKDEKKKKTNKNRNPVSCHHFDPDVSFLSRVNMQGNLITTPSEFEITFDFAIYLYSQTYNRKIERNKNLPKSFFADGNFLYSRFKI